MLETKCKGNVTLNWVEKAKENKEMVLQDAELVLAAHRDPKTKKLVIQAYSPNLKQLNSVCELPDNDRVLMDQVQVVFASLGKNSCTAAQVAGSWYTCG